MTTVKLKLDNEIDVLKEQRSFNNIVHLAFNRFQDGFKEKEIRAYLRGVFLTCGSINDPKTSRYHMELFISTPEESILVQKLLNLFDLNAKILSRDKGFMIYIKEAEKISDFIKILGANKAVMYFEDVRIYREQKNKTNRLRERSCRAINQALVKIGCETNKVL